MNWAIRKLNFKIDAGSLKDMYNSLMTDYKQRMFVVGEHAGHLKDEYGNTSMYGWTFDKAYGWALQTWEQDAGQPLAFINCGPSQFSDIQNTEMLKLMPASVRELFPSSWEFVVSCHPKDTFIKPHTDNGKYLKIHIPVQTSDKFYWLYGDDDKKYTMNDEGRCYLMNTQIRHGTLNESDIIRVHLIFKIPHDDAISLDYIEEV